MACAWLQHILLVSSVFLPLSIPFQSFHSPPSFILGEFTVHCLILPFLHLIQLWVIFTLYNILSVTHPYWMLWIFAISVLSEALPITHRLVTSLRGFIYR
jgi:hypothetical protein